MSKYQQRSLFVILNTFQCSLIVWLGNYNVFIIKNVKLYCIFVYLIINTLKCPSNISKLFYVLFSKRKIKQNIPNFHYFRISKWPSIIKPRTLATACKPYYAYANPLRRRCLPPDWFKPYIYNIENSGCTRARVRSYI